MGGEIGVVSTPGGGSTFSFSLEFGCELERLPCDFVVPDDIGRPHILLADTDPLSRASVHDRLLKLAFQCTVATSRPAGDRGMVARRAAVRPWPSSTRAWSIPAGSRSPKR